MFSGRRPSAPHRPWIAVALGGVFLVMGVIGGVRALAPRDVDFVDPATITPEPESPSPTKRLKPLPRLEGPAPSARPYKTIEALAAALKEKGLACTSLEYHEPPDPSLHEFALCDMQDPQRRSNIWLFLTKDLRDQWLSGMKGKIDLVHGPNWIVTAVGDESTAPRRAKLVSLAIGGRLIPKSDQG